MSAPMYLALQIGGWLFYALNLIALALEVWALVESARLPQQAYQRVGGRTKGFWLALTGAATAVGLIGVLLGGQSGMGLFGLVAVCIASVFLAGPRDDLRFYAGR